MSYVKGFTVYFFYKMRSYYVAQVGLELLGPGNLLLGCYHTVFLGWLLPQAQTTI